MEHQLLGEDTKIAFFFFFNAQVAATRPKAQGYRIRIMFYPLSMTLGSTTGLMNVRLSLRPQSWKGFRSS